MIFNLGGGAFETPTLNASYPADASISCIDGQSASATFTVEIAAHGAPTEYIYQWYEDGTAIAGANTDSYTKMVTTGGTHTYYCIVTNAAGTVTSRTATLTVDLYTLPVLDSSYPANMTQIESASGSATFKVSIATAGNPAEYAYQWYVDGAAVSGATGGSYTKTGLTSAATYTVYCTVTNAAGTVQSRTATLTVQSSQPSYTFTGTHQLIKDGTYNWRIKLKSSGTLKFTHFGTGAGAIDVFCVGGGGRGSSDDGVSNTGVGGGGGGYTKTVKNKTIALNTGYTITVGAGSTSGSSSGGQTSAFGVTADGGGTPYMSQKGGNGGSGGGAEGAAGGSNGGNGGNSPRDGSSGGTGQGSTTREFGESSGTLYSGGGGGSTWGGSSTNYGAGGSGGGGRGGPGSSAIAGTANTGGGGGGTAKAGGSGIVVIRNKR